MKTILYLWLLSVVLRLINLTIDVFYCPIIKVLIQFLESASKQVRYFQVYCFYLGGDHVKV